MANTLIVEYEGSIHAPTNHITNRDLSVLEAFKGLQLSGPNTTLDALAKLRTFFGDASGELVELLSGNKRPGKRLIGLLGGHDLGTIWASSAKMSPTAASWLST